MFDFMGEAVAVETYKMMDGGTSSFVFLIVSNTSYVLVYLGAL